MYPPTPEHVTTYKASPKLRLGVVVGNRLTSGAHWSGEYLVYDLDTFIGTYLGIGAHTSWGHMAPHVTMRVDVTQPDLFPVK